jgi:hypothetical protein
MTLVAKYVYPDYPSGVCVYCGESADTMDHLLPVAWTGEADRKRVPTVPSCRECNSTLNDHYIPDVPERRQYLHRLYRIKYKKALGAIMWGESDLEAMGASLRYAVQKLMDEHDRTRARLAWPTNPTYDADAWAHAWTKDGDPFAGSMQHIDA